MCLVYDLAGSSTIAASQGYTTREDSLVACVDFH